MILYPRLTKLAAERRFEDIRRLTIKKLAVDACTIPDEATFAQTGGQPATPEQLKKIRQSIIKIAQRFGFPDAGNEKSKAEFDAICAVWLRKQAGIGYGEGFRDGMWAYLTIELLPDVAAWRFPQKNARRFLGGVRNTFQRLWRRAFLLDYADDAKTLRQYLTSLQEDSFVQLIERPGSSANPYVSSHVAAAWVRASKDPNSGPMEALHRKVMKELTQIGAVICLDYLPEKDLNAMLDSLYRELSAAS
jgi:hypothetical protein